MKRFLLLALCLVLFSGSALAEIDQGGMSWAELLDLQQKIKLLSWPELLDLRQKVNLELFKRDEWQQVQVPTGMYKIGEDIPAGKWTIKPIDGQTAYVHWGVGTTDGGMEIDDLYVYEQITSPSDLVYSKYNKVESITLDLTAGTYLLIDNSPVVFTPFTGVSLGFK